MHTPIQVDAEPFAFQVVQEQFQNVVVVVSQVKVNVERRHLFHALEMPLQLRKEFFLCLVPSVFGKEITGDQYEPWSFNPHKVDQVIPFADHLVQIAGEDHFHRVEFVELNA